MKHRKKWPIAVLAVFLVACLAVGLTVAYNVVVKDPVVNAFNLTYGGPDPDVPVEAQLIEPGWDGIIAYEYDDGTLYPIYKYESDGTPVYGYEGGDPAKPITDKTKAPDGKRPDKSGEYGVDIADHLLPGIAIPKDPMIVNTSAVEIWTAMKVTFVYPQGHSKAGQPLALVDYAVLMDILELNYDTANWELADESLPSLTYYYKNRLTTSGSSGKAGGTTMPLFNAVSVKDNATNEQFEKVQNIGGFVIYIEGFAASAMELDTYTDFYSWGLNGGVVFNYTPTAAKPATYGADGIVRRPQ